MHLIRGQSIINLDYFPVITIQETSVMFGYEDDFNVPVDLHFDTEEDANEALASIAQGFNEGARCIELVKGEFR